MNKKNLIVFLICSLTGSVFGQQIAMYNQYHLTPRVYNPSYVGFEDGTDISLIRNQKWGNYGEGFNANNLSLGFALKGKHGLGVNLYNDFVGITSKLKANLLYSYKIQLADNMFLAAGLGAGVIDNRLDFSAAVVNDVSDPVLSNTGQARRTMFDLSVGINYFWSGLKIGVAVPQVLGSKLIYGDQAISYYTIERQFLSNIGYSWRINDEKGIVLRPEALVNFTPGAPIQYNGGLYFEMEKYFWIGGMYKSDYAVGLNFGINMLKNLKLGLAYDFQINELSTLNNSPNAEILLRYTIPNQVKEVQDNNGMDSLLLANQRQLDSLKQVINQKENHISELNDTNQFLKDSLSKWPSEVTSTQPPTEKVENVKTNSADHFIELNDKDSPNGYYVVGGAFAEKNNADALVRKIKSKFPSARIIKNKRNDLYYVLLYYSTKKGEGLAYASYKANQLPDEETWVLFYERNK